MFYTFFTSVATHGHRPSEYLWASFFSYLVSVGTYGEFVPARNIIFEDKFKLIVSN
jgi:hypothetical protein